MKNFFSRLRERYYASLKQTIAFSYIFIYILVSILVLSVFYGVTTSQQYNKVSSHSDNMEKVLTSIVYNGASQTQIIKQLDFFSAQYNCQISLYSNEKLIYTSIGQRNSVDLSKNTMGFVLVDIFPQAANFTQGFISDVRDITITGSEINKIAFVYDVRDNRDDILQLIRILAGTLVSGLLIMVVVSNGVLAKRLKPIEKISKEAESVTANNLSMRLNEDDAQYELKELVATINEMLSRLEASYTKQQQFVSDVSHEMRTPIAVISGYSEMLERWGKNDESILEEGIDAIKKETKNMRELVEKLLILVRYDKATMKYDFETFDLSVLMEEIVKECKMTDHNHSVADNIQKNILIKADAARVKQIVRILTDNAFKYTPNDKSIEISLSSDEQTNKAKIIIKDNGCGISKEDLPNIFDRFYRCDNSRTKDTGGHGLGLSIAKALVLDNKGEITVMSKLGEGTRFTVEFTKEN